MMKFLTLFDIEHVKGNEHEAALTYSVVIHFYADPQKAKNEMPRKVRIMMLK